jgi:hypothetical protein
LERIMYDLWKCLNTDCWVWEYLGDGGQTRPNTCPCCNKLGEWAHVGPTDGK